ncbi:MAG: ParB/RepB/Spo0J family partition protein [Spirochaetes bacterium]|nr:ParB/RepB/Spo0J family partition protein [Spirochaetota bacterium]
MATKRALGRGISALIRDQGFKEEDISEEGLTEISLTKIDPNTWQPRKHFDEAEIENLAHSIRENGLMTPILVRKRGMERYEIVAGERRFRAFKFLKKLKIPAIVVTVADNKMLELALIENIQREELSPIEVAESYKRLITDLGLKHDELATRLGKSRPVITNAMRLLDLPASVQKYLVEGKISEGHARIILSLPDETARISFAETIVADGLSVKKAEDALKSKRDKKKGKSGAEEARKDPNVKKVESDLTKLFGTKVSVHDEKGKGRIVIEYYDSEDFSRIMDILEK